MSEVKAESLRAKEALGAVADELNGHFSDGEFAVGPEGSEVWISTADGATFDLASESPLYTFKRGKPKLVRAESDGWSYATIGADRIRSALERAFSQCDSEQSELEFAYESILRDHCAQNLNQIEDGLTIYERGGIRGVEFAIHGRFIDILAVDSHGDLVVIEFKLSYGPDAVVGQLAHYLGAVRKNLASANQRVRGIIVARKISEGLRLAAAQLTDVALYQYDLSINIKKV